MPYGIDYLRAKLRKKKFRVNIRYAYYDMKNRTRYLSKLMPTEYGWLSHSLGWCGKAVDSIADRLSVYGFRSDDFGMEEIFKQNNSDILFDSAMLSALISSCSFIYISIKDDFPTMEVIDGSRATGIIDDVTNMLIEGYAVLEEDKNHQPTLEAYFLPGSITYYPKDEEPYVVENSAPYCLLVPIIYRPDAKRPFGHSRISRACMSIQDSAIRTLKRSEVAAEFYAFPQKYILGMEEDAEFNNRAATMSTFLRIDKDSEGDHPVIGQFTQQSMQPYLDNLRHMASLFGAETGLTLDDLGFPSQNPSSSEAIKAAHENLRLTARKTQKQFATGFINAGYLARCLADDIPYARKEIYNTEIAWNPIFEPDSTMISAIGDGVIKINQAMPGYVNEETLRELTGIRHYDE